MAMDESENPAFILPFQGEVPEGLLLSQNRETPAAHFHYQNSSLHTNFKGCGQH